MKRSFVHLLVIVLMTWVPNLRVLAQGLTSQVVQTFQKAVSSKDLDKTGSVALYRKLEKNLVQAIALDPELSDQARTAGSELGMTYLTNARIQEAIWAFERGGLYSEAEALTQQVESLLSTGDLSIGNRVGRGISKSFFGKVGGIPVLIKPRDEKKSVEAEVWTFQLDRALGLNLVPTVIKRTVNGEEYSVHLLLNGATLSGLNFRDRGYQLEYPEIYVLDFITDQLDRHYENSMFDVADRLFAIDHGRVFGSGAVRYSGEPFGKYDSRFVPNNSVLSNLKSADLQSIEEIMKRHSDTLVADFIVVQLRKVVDSLPIPIRPALYRPNESQIRLSPGKPKKISAATKRKLEQASSQEFQDRLKSILESKNRGSLEYQERNGLKLTENGHLALETYQFAKAKGITNYQAIFLKNLREMYEQSRIGY